MIKEFLVNLKYIEPNQINPYEKEEDKQEKTQIFMLKIMKMIKMQLIQNDA